MITIPITPNPRSLASLFPLTFHIIAISSFTVSSSLRPHELAFYILHTYWDQHLGPAYTKLLHDNMPFCSQPQRWSLAKGLAKALLQPHNQRTVLTVDDPHAVEHFVQELLMPRSALSMLISSGITTTSQLSSRFGVPESVMTQRLLDPTLHPSRRMTP